MEFFGDLADPRSSVNRKHASLVLECDVPWYAFQNDLYLPLYWAYHPELLGIC